MHRENKRQYLGDSAIKGLRTFYLLSLSSSKKTLVFFPFSSSSLFFAAKLLICSEPVLIHLTRKSCP